MKEKKHENYDDIDEILFENELQASYYISICLLVCAGASAIIWILNAIGFFIVDKQLMNITMSIGIVLAICPYIIQKTFDIRSFKWKYMMMMIFLIVVSIMSMALTVQTVLLWACPLVLACHYYSVRFARFTLIAALVFMLFSFIIGIYVGVWDSNIMHSNTSLNTFVERVEYMELLKAQGTDILTRALQFYYIPRAAILWFIYIICSTLSVRTNSLIKKQGMLSKEKERIGAELSVANHIQASMLPSTFPAFPEREEIDIYAIMTPAKEVGGDFYDFFFVDEDHLAMVMADVSGKGVPAALFMMLSKTLIKNAAHSGATPKEILEKVNNQLCEENHAQMFVTVWLGIYEISTGKLVSANAGHEDHIILHKDGGVERCKDKHGFVLAGMENMKYKDYEWELKQGDKLFVYTDGVTEAMDSDNAQYGTQRMLTVLEKHKACSMEEILYYVKDDIDSFVGKSPQFDDITMLGFEVKGM